MTDKEYSEKCVKVGLDQIPLDGLKRVMKRIDEGQPVLMNGGVISACGKYG